MLEKWKREIRKTFRTDTEKFIGWIAILMGAMFAAYMVVSAYIEVSK